MFFCFFQQFIRIFKYFWVFVCPGNIQSFATVPTLSKLFVQGFMRFIIAFPIFSPSSSRFCIFLYIFHLYLTEFLCFSRYNRILFHVKHMEKQMCSVINPRIFLPILRRIPIGEATTFKKNNLISCSYLNYYIFLIVAFVLIVAFLLAFCFCSYQSS